MDRISLSQQFRKRALKGVDGCKDKERRETSSIRKRALKGVDGCKDKKRRETSSMGSARLPEPSHCLSASTDHQQQRLLNSIFPCFFPSKAGREGQTVSCFSPFEQEQEQGRSYTLGSNKKIPWSQRIIVCQFGTCHPYIIALFNSCNLLRITLLNPISGHEITLPGSPLSWFDFEGGLRFALSLPPHSSPPCYTVFIIFRCSESKLLLYRNKTVRGHEKSVSRLKKPKTYHLQRLANNILNSAFPSPFSTLRHLSLNNNLTGPLPPSISNLSSLRHRHLHLGGNFFQLLLWRHPRILRKPRHPPIPSPLRQRARRRHPRILNYYSSSQLE